MWTVHYPSSYQQHHLSMLKLEVDKDILTHSRDKLRLLIKEAKTSFLNSKITENSGPFIGSLTHFFSRNLVWNSLDMNHFLIYWTSSVNSFRTNLAISDLAWTRMFSLKRIAVHRVNAVPVRSLRSPQWKEDDILLIKRSLNKSSTHDPIPTSLVKNFAGILARSLAKLINISLSTGVLPDEMKIAFVTPLLKKPDLCLDVLGNYRPVYNLSFLWKLVELAAGKQLLEYLEVSGLLVPVQSAYRSHHSTETALLKVMNDFLLAADSKKAPLL